jgi:hypothetical protein
VSTILDALKKVERDRESPRDELLDSEIPEAPGRHGISTRVIIACASIGFAAGIALALWRDTAPLQQPPAPEPVAPPAIEVPPPPAVVKARPKAPVPRPQAPAAMAKAAPPAQAPPAGRAASSGTASAAPAQPATGAPVVVGSVEPSPFTPEREARQAAPPPERHGGSHDNRRARTAARPEPAQPDNAVAALAPPRPAVPPVVPAPQAVEAPPVVPAPAAPAEAEPEQPPPVVIDTGRSPPGAPRVSLTFLQWSADPDRRFAFVSIDGAPSQRVREGDMASGMTVAQITPTGVQFRREGQLFMIRPRH